jgi:hypothetical protein
MKTPMIADRDEKVLRRDQDRVGGFSEEPFKTQCMKSPCFSQSKSIQKTISLIPNN